MNWEYAGPENTQATAALAVKRAVELGITHFVVASNSGHTAEVLLEELESADLSQRTRVAVVTHHVGFREPGADEMSAEMRETLQTRYCSVLTTTHLFANIERAITSKHGGLYPGGIAAAALRLFGQGTKVCVEIAVMAVDAGMIPPDQPVMVLGGSGQGADTALVIQAAHAKDFFDTQVLEVVCKPRCLRRRPK